MLTLVVTCFVALALIYVPMSSELTLGWLAIFNFTYVRYGKYKKFDFPYRIPRHANLYDGSYAKRTLGKGITFLGREISTKLEVWSADSDLRTHMLMLGTTGSGKTEALLGIVFNALVQNSGFVYIDGKGDPKLLENVFRLCRFTGRDDELLAVSFLTSGRDFLEKQFDRTSNTAAPFAMGSSGMITELQISLMDDSTGGGADMWKGRAIAFISALNKPMCYFRDKGYLLLEPNSYMDFFELPILERMVFEKKVTFNGVEIEIKDELFDRVLEPLKAFILTLPGYSHNKRGEQEQKTLEQFGFIVMQLTRLFGDMSYTYAHLFSTALGEVDMNDVVLNRRILAILLPALERAPDSLKMLGKIIVGQIKQMMAGSLGNRVEGITREIIDSRPTAAKVPMYVVLDEYGYYAVVGFAVAPAQARSLGFPQPLASRIRLADGSTKTMGSIKAGDVIAAPTNKGIVPAVVSSVVDSGVRQVHRITLADGRTAEAADCHLWTIRCNGEEIMLPTDTIQRLLKSTTIEFPVWDGSKHWIEVKTIVQTDTEPVRCIVVNNPEHHYITDGDLVTHNCIVFAAQDFSSLKKASAEEADATWENTNVRIVGRIVGGSESETYKRISGVAGEAIVEVIGGKEHKLGDINDTYRTNRDTRFESRSRLSYDDLAGQQDGEFTILVGKKNADGTQGVKVIRARTFYTASTRPREFRLNHFLPVEPPTTHEIKEADKAQSLEDALFKALASGDLARVFPNDCSRIITATTSVDDKLFRIASYLASADKIVSPGAPERGFALAKLAVLAWANEREIAQKRINQEAERIANQRAFEGMGAEISDQLKDTTLPYEHSEKAQRIEDGTRNIPTAPEIKPIPKSLGTTVVDGAISDFVRDYLYHDTTESRRKNYAETTGAKTSPVCWNLFTGSTLFHDSDFDDMAFCADVLEESIDETAMREDRARQLQAQVRNTNEMIATLTNDRDHDIFTLKSTAAALTDEITQTSCYIEGEVPEPVQPNQVDGILKELCDWYGVNGA
jgi:hypothetical protein